jgi:hypothetical protein
METTRLTTAQAIVRYLIAQRTVVDGAEVPIYPAESTGLIRFTAGPGPHAIELNWKRTGPRWGGEMLSILSLLVCALLLRRVARP